MFTPPMLKPPSEDAETNVKLNLVAYEVQYDEDQNLYFMNDYQPITGD
jgi:hypothetical protein